MGVPNDDTSLVNGTFSYSRTDKIRILKIVNAQMQAMLTVNQNALDGGSTDQGIPKLREILQDEIRKNNLKIDKLMRGEKLKLNHFQHSENEEDDI